MQNKKNNGQKSGGSRLIASGKKPVLLGIEPEKHKLLSNAAIADGRPLTQFLLFHGLVAAEKILKKIENTH